MQKNTAVKCNFTREMKVNFDKIAATGLNHCILSSGWSTAPSNIIENNKPKRQWSNHGAAFIFTKFALTITRLRKLGADQHIRFNGWHL